MEKKAAIILFGLPTGASRRNELANRISSSLFEATHRTALVSTENIRNMIWKPTYRSEDEEEIVYKNVKLVSLTFVASGYNVVISGVFGNKKWYDDLLQSLRQNAEEVLPIYIVRENMKKAVDETYLVKRNAFHQATREMSRITLRNSQRGLKITILPFV